MSKNTIVMFPKIQVDTAIAFYLLKKFGKNKFPDIAEAEIDFWTELPEDKTADELEKQGYILIDLGNGQFDHHRLGETNKEKSASHLIAEYLGIEKKPTLQRMLEFARRDDLEGKGVKSTDPIDRAFSLPGMLANLNKTIPDDPKRILEIILPLIHAHYLEQKRRLEDLPKAYEKSKAEGKTKEHKAAQGRINIKIIHIKSDDPAMAGYLRSKNVKAGVVVQRTSTGHANIITLQYLKLKLHKVARYLKEEEAKKSNIELPEDESLEKPGRTEGLPHWFYDTRANTIQNGGVSPGDVPPTELSDKEIIDAVKRGLKDGGQSLPGEDEFKVSYGRGAMYIE